MTLKVARVIDQYTVVVNAGSSASVSDGQRFLIYSIGDEVTDPDTGESLGALEIVKGTGRATHVQDKMSTVASDMKAQAGRTIRSKPSTYGRGLVGIMSDLASQTEEILPAEKIPFEKVKVGDLARLI